MKDSKTINILGAASGAPELARQQNYLSLHVHVGVLVEISNCVNDKCVVILEMKTIWKYKYIYSCDIKLEKVMFVF